jgi:hypothetical protein
MYRSVPIFAPSIEKLRQLFEELRREYQHDVSELLANQSYIIVAQMNIHGVSSEGLTKA